LGRGLGYLDNEWQDVHGAGCQRSNPKTGDPNNYPTGHGPQGDAVRIYNFVRCVRTTTAYQADFDGDDDVDVADFAKFQLCLAGPGVAPACP
jgi:hypothetical protein